LGIGADRTATPAALKAGVPLPCSLVEGHRSGFNPRRQILTPVKPSLATNAAAVNLCHTVFADVQLMESIP